MFHDLQILEGLKMLSQEKLVRGDEVAAQSQHILCMTCYFYFQTSGLLLDFRCLLAMQNALLLLKIEAQSLQQSSE